MRLPYAELAVVDVAKLRDYGLDMAHPRGKHKAKVFKSRLGLTADDAEFLRAVLLEAANSDGARAGVSDAFGQRYVLDLEVTTELGTATVRSAWMVCTGEAFPRLVTCYVL